MARKTIQVDEQVHARFSEMWRKLPRWSMEGDSASHVIEYLMDFYENHRKSEVEQAMALIKTIKDRLDVERGEQLAKMYRERESNG